MVLCQQYNAATSQESMKSKHDWESLQPLHSSNAEPHLKSLYNMARHSELAIKRPLSYGKWRLLTFTILPLNKMVCVPPSILFPALCLNMEASLWPLLQYSQAHHQCSSSFRWHDTFLPILPPDLTQQLVQTRPHMQSAIDRSPAASLPYGYLHSNLRQ